MTVIGILQLKEFVVTRWRLWKTLQAWQAEGTHNAVASWLQECRIPTCGGWWGVLWLMTKSNRHLDCLKKQIRKAGEEHETFTRGVLAVLLSLTVCLHVSSVLLQLWWGWPGDENEAVHEKKSEAKTKRMDKKPLLKRLRNKWKKYPLKKKVRNFNFLSFKGKLKTFPFKKKWKNLRNIKVMKRWRKHDSSTESQIMKELETYITKTRMKTYIYFLKVAVKEMFQVLILMTMKSIRQKLGLGSTASHEGRAETERTITSY